MTMVLLTFFLCFFILQGPIATSTSIYLHDGGCPHVDQVFEELMVVKMVGFSWIGCFKSAWMDSSESTIASNKLSTASV